MSELTYLNRWQRYQVARLQGLIDGLKSEARRLDGRDFTPAIDALGKAMMDDLIAHCEQLRAQVKKGDKVELPELRFERL
jgi:hypothetical protein